MSRELRSLFIQAALRTDSEHALGVMLRTGCRQQFEDALRRRGERHGRKQHLSNRYWRQTHESELTKLNILGARYLTPLCAKWPHQASKPGLLRVMGQMPVQQSCALVGTRKSSREAMHRAQQLGRLLASVGQTVISGGALGIDIQALRGAHEQKGSTITVLGSGLCHPSPKVHLDMFTAFLTRGAIVSSFPCDQKPQRWTFAKRNKWIALMSDTCVVLEANERSGALMAARESLKMGRSVYVPDDLSNVGRMMGCRALADEGAKPLSQLVGNILKDDPCFRDEFILDPLQQSLLDALSLRASTPSRLTKVANVNYIKVTRALSSLKERGLIQEDLDGRWYRLGLKIDGTRGWWRSDVLTH